MKPPTPFYCNAPLHWKTAFHCLWLWLWNTNLPHSLNSLWTVLRLQKLDKSSGWGGSGEHGGCGLQCGERFACGQKCALGCLFLLLFYFGLAMAGPVDFFFCLCKVDSGCKPNKRGQHCCRNVTWSNMTYKSLFLFSWSWAVHGVPRTLFMSGCLCDICFHFWTLLIHTALIFRMSELDCFQMAFLMQF